MAGCLGQRGAVRERCRGKDLMRGAGSGLSMQDLRIASASTFPAGERDRFDRPQAWRRESDAPEIADQEDAAKDAPLACWIMAAT